jgi:sec-independent protein translocase protein TatA
MFGLSVQEVVIVGIVAILLFGKRLPDVAKTMGARYREFRKGLAEIQSSFNAAEYSLRNLTSQSVSTTTKSSSSTTSDKYSEYDDYDEPTAPKFEPPPSAPQLSSPHETTGQTQSD